MGKVGSNGGRQGGKEGGRKGGREVGRQGSREAGSRWEERVFLNAIFFD